MTERNVSVRRVSGRQLDMLFEFLNSNRDIANSYNRTLQAKQYSTRKWTEVSEILNAQGDGAYKDWRGWCKYWVDFKAKLKKKVAGLRASRARTGGGPSTEQPLSEIESKFLQILGEDFGQGLPGIRVEPFPEPSGSYVATDAQDSPASQSILQPVGVLLPTESPATEASVPVDNQQNGPVPEARLGSPSSQRTPSLSPPPARPAPTAEARVSRRRRRRNTPMSHEAARHALTRSSQMRAEAAERAAQAQEAIARGISNIVQTLEGIKNSLERIESTIHGAFPTAAE